MNSLSVPYDDLWRILEEYSFNIDVELHSDLLCIFCKKILKNARQAPCGCRYCHACIVNFIGNQSNFCIGETEDCKKQIINHINEVHVDNAANRMISGLVVKCPEELCSFTCELKHIESHILIHQINCPFKFIGCSHPRIGLEKMIDHLHVENYSHSTLLMDAIQNSKNEMAILKEDAQVKDFAVSELQREHNELKENFERICDVNASYDERIAILVTENQKLTTDLKGALKKITEIQSKVNSQEKIIDNMVSQMDEVHISHTVKLSDLETNAASYKNEVSNLEIRLDSANIDLITFDKSIKLHQEWIRDLETKFNNCRSEADDEENLWQDESARLRVENEEIRSEIGVIKEEFLREKEIISDIELSINSIRSSVERTVQPTESVDSQEQVKGLRPIYDSESEVSSVPMDSVVTPEKLDQELDNLSISVINIAPFFWKIDKFSEKRQKAQAGIISFINSDPFYSHESGYQLCLSVFPGGCGSGKRSHLTVGGRIMKGPHDGQLSWPMELGITISLMDQKYNAVHTSHRFQYRSIPVKSRVRFNRPQHVINEGFGATRFISLNKLLNDARLLLNDSIVLRCVINT